MDVSQTGAVDLVVVWDLDETLIVFNSLLSGAYARAAAAAHGRGPADGAAAASAAAKVALADESGADGAVAEAVAESSLPREAAALGQRLADFVFDFCDNHMDFRALDTVDPMSFAELWAEASVAIAQAEADADSPAAGGDNNAGRAGAGRRGVATRATLERIATVYAGGAEGLTEVVGAEGRRALAEALAEVERLTGGWVSAARRLLAGVSAAAEAADASSAGPGPGVMAEAGAPPALVFRGVRHVLVSAGHLVATLGKLLLWGLDPHFDIRDVYSASGRTKLDAFRALRSRFGPSAAFVAVGDGAEEERAATVMGWGFVRVALTEAAGAAAVAARSRLVSRAGPAVTTAVAAAEVVAEEPGAAEAEGERPWRMPRPVAAIRAEEVLAAAREAYFD
ncbi:hypothetical protein GPECTOR_18g101 [Gonium pectorale]|uniref:protein-tyrosine-phosphatase n=1 Tax=Gonium pectorale TaxID=33097 RepID=A0A150GJG2_GONPE|nr:hypothetical protein GPECTOR_18g101 [Gonium pectorale]|eukprot:KXZ49943.1 hypothetical protein GPECTOR_18g101 [Gonium pectorale]